MTMATADSSATIAAPGPAHQSVREFTRLAAHARLITAGILLLFRSAIIGILLFVWPAVTEPSYYGNAILPAQLIEVMITAAITIWCMQFLTPWHSRPIRTALFTTMAVILWTSLAALLFWNEGMPDRLMHLTRLASVITAAATVATIAARYARLLLQPGDLHPATSSTPTPPAPFARFCPSCATVLGDADTCPTCGRNMPRPDLRPALGLELTRMRTAWQSSLLNLRCLALLVGTLILAGTAQSWSGQFFYGGGHPDPVFDLTLCSILGMLAGGGVAFLAIHRPRSCAAAIAGGVTFMGFAAGFILFHLAASSLAYISLPTLFWQFIVLASAAAAASSLITHWLLTIIVTRFAPRASAQLMLGRTIDDPAPSTPAPPPSPRTCESCGYQLEGLPATRCDKCSIVGLRCPECGHTQPANTLNARALRLIYRMHTAVRVITWVAGLGTIFCLLLTWFTVAKLVGLQQSFGRLTWKEGLGFVLASFVLVGPIRLLLLHGRRLWLISLLVALLPAVAMLLGSSGGSPGGSILMAWDLTVFFIPGWLVVSFGFPYLWRLWTWMIYGSAIGADLYHWHRSPAFRYSSSEQILTDPDRALGREIPLRCTGCGSAIPTNPTSSCPACGIHSLPCPTCKEPLAISAVRIGFESILHRLRLAGLALLAILAAAALVVLIVADLVNGSSIFWYASSLEHSSPGYLANTIEAGIICAILFGILGRMMFIRRPTIIAAGVVVVMHTLWFVVFPLAFSRGQFRPNPITYAVLLTLLVALISGGLAFIAALLSRPLLRLAVYCVSPDLRQPLYLWITGKQTLDQAAQQVS